MLALFPPRMFGLVACGSKRIALALFTFNSRAVESVVPAALVTRWPPTYARLGVYTPYPSALSARP